MFSPHDKIIQFRFENIVFKSFGKREIGLQNGSQREIAKQLVGC